MFTGFPAIVVFSQNLITATQSEANFPKTSTIVLTNLSSQIKLNSLIKSSVAISVSSINSTPISSAISSEAISSSTITSSEAVVKIKEDTKVETKPEPIVETPIPVITKREINPSAIKVVQSPPAPQPKVELTTAPAKVQEVIKPAPVVLSSSSVASSSQVVTVQEVAPIKPAATTPAPLTNLSYSDQIRARCETLGCNATQMIRVMMCESGGRQSAQNGIYTGIFQFNPQTFYGYTAKSGLPNGSVNNGNDQVIVATWMFANGQGRQWECQ